jgi:hypothetical protein
VHFDSHLSPTGSSLVIGDLIRSPAFARLVPSVGGGQGADGEPPASHLR